MTGIGEISGFGKTVATVQDDSEASQFRDGS
jgi:hypothetical protein